METIDAIWEWIPRAGMLYMYFCTILVTVRGVTLAVRDARQTASARKRFASVVSEALIAEGAPRTATSRNELVRAMRRYYTDSGDFAQDVQSMRAVISLRAGQMRAGMGKLGKPS